MDPQQPAKGDATLVVEMIRLLSDELQRVQSEIEDLQNSRPLPIARVGSSPMANADELYALQEENVQMRSQLESVKARLVGLRGGVHGDPSNMEHLDKRLGELSEESSQKDAEYTKSREKLSTKIEVVRVKYKEQKATGIKLQESISEVETHIARVQTFQGEGSQRLEDLAGELARQEELEATFDARAFLKEPRRKGENKLPRTPRFPASGARLVLPEAVLALCVPSGYMVKQSEEIAWSQHTPRTRCLVLGPTHRYNPKLRDSKGGWEAVPEDASQRPEEVEFFYRESQTHWCYLGTFHYVGQDVRSIQDLGKAAQEGLETIRARTVVFDYMIPKLIMDLLKDMYDSGLLKVTCVGWRRIGFNQALAEALHSM